jgi:hypothetical protein
MEKYFLDIPVVKQSAETLDDHVQYFIYSFTIFSYIATALEKFFFSAGKRERNFDLIFFCTWVLEFEIMLYCAVEGRT